MKTNKAVGDCPYCNPPTRCPYCDPDWRRRHDPWVEAQCVLNKPLMIVIPPEGMHLSCPVHPEGHHVFGTGVVWCEQQPTRPIVDYDSTQRFIDYDSTRSPGSTCTGDTIRDTCKTVS